MTLPAKELALCMDELAEIAGYAGVNVIVTNKLSAGIPARHATLFYDLMYSAIAWAASFCEAAQNSTSMIVSLAQEDNNITMRIMLQEDAARSFAMNADIARAVESTGGVYAVKDLDDAAGISLSFSSSGLDAAGGTNNA